MNQLQLFNHETFGEVRTIVKDGEPYFVAKDVAEVLGYANPQKAIRDHCKGVNELFIPSNGGMQKTNIIPERDVYRLIMRSTLPSAERFEEWVVGEVIPSIRKNGGYIANQENLTPEQIVANALVVAQNIINEKQRQLEQAHQTIEIQKPKAEYFDELVDRNLLITIRDTAKELKIKERKFVQWLLENKYVYRNRNKQLRPRAQYVPDLFEIKEFVNSNGYTGVQVYVTPKGRETFRLLLSKRK